MSTKEYKHTVLQAKVLGRVERLLGSDCNANPFPEMTKQWTAFREGWFRDLTNSLSCELRTGNK